MKKLILAIALSLCVGQVGATGVSVINKTNIGGGEFYVLCINNVVYYAWKNSLTMAYTKYGKPLTCGRYSF